MADRTLYAVTNGGLQYAETTVDEALVYASEIAQNNTTESTDPATTDELLSFDASGNLRRISTDNFQQAIHFTIPGGPDASVTSDSDFFLVIPIGSTGSQSAFGDGDVTAFTVTGVSVCAEYYAQAYLSSQTTIQISNKLKGDVTADTINVTLTNTGATTDRYNSAAGTVAIDPSTEALYVHLTIAGGHSNIQGWIWTYKTSA